LADAKKSFNKLLNGVNRLNSSVLKERLDLSKDSGFCVISNVEKDVESLLKIRDKIIKKRSNLMSSGKKQALHWIDGGTPLLEFLKTDKKMTSENISSINKSDSILYYDTKAIEDLENNGLLSLHGTAFCDFDGVFTKNGCNLTVNHFNPNNSFMGFADVGFTHGKFDSIVPLLEKYNLSEIPKSNSKDSMINDYGIINNDLLFKVSEELKSGFFDYYNFGEKNSDMNYLSIVLDMVYNNMKHQDKCPISDSFAYNVFIQSVLGVDVFFFTTLSEHLSAKLLINPLKSVLSGFGLDTEIIVKGTKFDFDNKGRCIKDNIIVNHGYEKISFFKPLVEKLDGNLINLCKSSEAHILDTPSDMMILDSQGVSRYDMVSRPTAFIKIVTDGVGDLAMLDILKKKAGLQDIDVYTISMETWRSQIDKMSTMSVPIYIVNDISKFTYGLEQEQDALLDLYFIGTTGVCELSKIFIELKGLLSNNVSFSNYNITCVKDFLDTQCKIFSDKYDFAKRSKSFNILDMFRRGIIEEDGEYLSILDYKNYLSGSRLFGTNIEKLNKLEVIDNELSQISFDSNSNKMLNIPGYKITGYIPHNSAQFQNNFTKIIESDLNLKKYFGLSSKLLKQEGFLKNIVGNEIVINSDVIEYMAGIYESRLGYVGDN